MNTNCQLLHPPLTGSFPPERVADPTFDLVVAELEKARESVEIFMYVWRSDEAGTRVGEAVLAAAERGVKVRIIKDIGAIMCEVIEMNRKPFFPRRIPVLKRIVYKIIGRTFPDTFVEDGHDQELGARLLTHPNVTIEWINKTHTKYYIFDERLIITGSINLEDRHQNYFDYMLALEDPDLARRLRTRMAGEAPSDPERNIDFLCNTHRDEGGSVFEIKPEVLRFIEEARESIYIEVAYIGDPEFADALVAAAGRGVRVTVLFSREANIGNDVNYWAIHDLYTRAPIEVYLTGTMIHAKLLLFDDELILTGSCNMNIFSLPKAAELDLVIRNEPALIEAIRALIAKRIEASSRVASAEELAGFNPILASLQQLHQKLNPN
ncbi:MAG: phosphatidylserine/phosphatidylglycerophosphate/cardiolipin synthase family protein [Verrucomicrobiota bacterium]|nr:phosphatidylserine/phosphatidylglycerophosphate/cardiolipin synthase family protein [Verrucomicrobiota bacterium]